MKITLPSGEVRDLKIGQPVVGLSILELRMDGRDAARVAAMTGSERELFNDWLYHLLLTKVERTGSQDSK